MAHTSNNTVKKLSWVGRFCLGIFGKGENVRSGAKGLGRDGNAQLDIEASQLQQTLNNRVSAVIGLLEGLSIDESEVILKSTLAQLRYHSHVQLQK